MAAYLEDLRQLGLDDYQMFNTQGDSFDRAAVALRLREAVATWVLGGELPGHAFPTPADVLEAFNRLKTAVLGAGLPACPSPFPCDLHETLCMGPWAVLAEETILNVLPVGVEQIQQFVSVNLFRGREQSDFVFGGDPFEKFPDARPGANKNLVRLVLELNWEGQRGVFHLLKRAVNECLIQVKDEGEARTGTCLKRQCRISEPHV